MMITSYLVAHWQQCCAVNELILQLGKFSSSFCQDNNSPFFLHTHSIPLIVILARAAAAPVARLVPPFNFLITIEIWQEQKKTFKILHIQSTVNNSIYGTQQVFFSSNQTTQLDCSFWASLRNFKRKKIISSKICR